MTEAEEVSALKNDLCLLSLLAISLSRIFCDGLMNPKLRADIVSKVLQLLESGKIFFSIIAKLFLHICKSQLFFPILVPNAVLM